MADINWLQVAIGFVGGGATGALIKQYFESRKSRIQPIAKSIEIKSFYDSLENNILNSQVILTGEDQEHKFSKLYTGTIKIINSGLIDYPEFSFGITGNDNMKFINVKPTTIDRHHRAEFNDPPSLENQINSFDLVLKPFNRKDVYTFDILVTPLEGDLNEKEIKISSSHPVKWVDITSTSKIILEIATESILALGPFSVGIRKNNN